MGECGFGLGGGDQVVLGRLHLPGPVAEVLPAARTDNDFSPLPISVDHALRVSELPHHHADPFDHILIAQAIAESLTIVTADAISARYPVPILAA